MSGDMAGIYERLMNPKSYDPASIDAQVAINPDIFGSDNDVWNTQVAQAFVRVLGRVFWRVGYLDIRTALTFNGPCLLTCEDIWISQDIKGLVNLCYVHFVENKFDVENTCNHMITNGIIV